MFLCKTFLVHNKIRSNTVIAGLLLSTLICSVCVFFFFFLFVYLFLLFFFFFQNNMKGWRDTLIAYQSNSVIHHFCFCGPVHAVIFLYSPWIFWSKIWCFSSTNWHPIEHPCFTEHFQSCFCEFNSPYVSCDRGNSMSYNTHQQRSPLFFSGYFRILQRFDKVGDIHRKMTPGHKSKWALLNAIQLILVNILNSCK